MKDKDKYCGMQFSFIQWVIVFSVLSVPRMGHTQSLINYRGNPVYLNGMNLAWNNFGWDIGRHPSKGVGYDPEWFEEVFTELESYGANAARFWIHADGRASPEFNSDGSIRGLDDNFFEHLDDLIQRAENHNIYLILCLWSFDMVHNNRLCCGTYAGNHADLIRDPVKTQGYIDKVLIPMVERYRDRCGVFAWEIINEPEWTIDGIGDKGDLVTKEEIQRFVAMMATAIHDHSDKMVTVGSASLKWNSNYMPPSKGNFWSDAALQNAFPDQGAYLDFYQIHFFDWMKDGFANFDPFTRPATIWELDKATLIGEAAAFSSYYKPLDMLQAAFTNAYAGTLLWSYNASSWFNAREAFQTEGRAKHALIRYACSPQITSNESFLFPANPILRGEPMRFELSLTEPGVFSLEIIDLQGRTKLVRKDELPEGQHLLLVSTGILRSGVYFMKINGGDFKKIMVL